MTQIAEGGIGLETRITDIDGVTLIEVIDDERFYDKFDFTDGFDPVASTSHKINFSSESQNVLLLYNFLLRDYLPRLQNQS